MNGSLDVISAIRTLAIKVSTLLVSHLNLAHFAFADSVVRSTYQIFAVVPILSTFTAKAAAQAKADVGGSA